MGFAVLILYLQDFPPFFPVLREINALKIGHFWSLAVEEQFYIFWPFVLFSARRHLGSLCITLWILSLGYRIVASHFSAEWSFNFLPGRVGELCAGAYLAHALRADKPILKFAVPVLIISALVLVAIFFATNSFTWTPSITNTLGLAVASTLFASLIAVALSGGAVQHIFELSLLRWIGKISYGIYVYHLLLEPLFSYLAYHLVATTSGNSFLISRFFVALVGTLVVSTISFRYLETPARSIALRHVVVPS